MSKRYYWLRLKDDFFEDETIKLLESMDNGKDYVIFLLKLRLKSINTNGYLNFKGLMPYNEKMLATITNTNIDTVKAALPVFQEIGLMDKLDDGTLFLRQIDELIGSETDSAKRMREHRASNIQLLPEKASHSDSDVQISDIEKEKEKEKEKDKPPAEPKVKYADAVEMKEKEYNKLVERFGETATKQMIEILDNYKGSTGKAYKEDYKAILSWVVKRYEQDYGKAKPVAREVYR